MTITASTTTSGLAKPEFWDWLDDGWRGQATLMTATPPPGLEGKSPAELKHDDSDASSLTDEDVVAGALLEDGGSLSDHAIGPGGIKEETLNQANGHEMDIDEPLETPKTATTLRPAPQPSMKRRESTAAEESAPDVKAKSDKKRKRGVSPPWQFPTAQTSTIKTADGRRVSARFGTGSNTPAVSETESRVRSDSRANSQSRPPSPPWKKFAAQGPTTLQVDGKRKSGRVNRETNDTPQPKRVSPRSKKVVDKLASSAKDSNSQVKVQKKVTAETPTRKSTRESLRSTRGTGDQAKIEDLKARIAELDPTRSFEPPAENVDANLEQERNRKTGETRSSRRQTSPVTQRKLHRPSDVSESPETSRPGFKLKLRRQNNFAPVEPPHPNAVPPSPPKPPRRNLYQVIEDYELKEQQQPYSENERGPPSREEFAIRHQRAAEQEATMRQKILDAAQPGKPLSVDFCSIYREDHAQKEPPPQYGHGDHLASHVLYFRHLQLREKQNHCQVAKKIAYEALDYWKTKRGPTEEDIRAEADKTFKLIAKQVAFDLRTKWEMVQKYVDDRRRAQWEAEQEVKRQERLNKQLKWSQNMVARQRGEAESDLDMSDEEGSVGDDSASGQDSNSEDDEDGEENMSDSASEALSNGGEEEEEEEGDMDEDALAAYLAQRDADLPERTAQTLEQQDEDDDEQSASDSGSEMGKARDTETQASSVVENTTTDHFVASRDTGSPMDLDDTAKDTARSVADASVDAHKRLPTDEYNSIIAQEMSNADDGLSSDESTDMDSEDYDSDEDMNDTDEDNNDGSDDDEEQSISSEDPSHSNSLWALFSAKEKKALGLPTPVTSAEENPDDREEDQPYVETEEPKSLAEEIIDDVTSHADIAKDGDVIMTEPSADQASDGTAPPRATNTLLETPAPGTPASQSRSDSLIKQAVPQPTLLRGDLRSYQQAGLEWLASLYRNKTNGILADEMGLGKTIQTIALLAYLAEQHGIWDTHLVIVPTSVILNWVTEFQKFLPGFRVLGYYGTTEERLLKRKGWVNDPHHDQKEKRGYNVVVTSYNIALRDINALRNVKWHYMILDEAHNIRNFNSQRFQVLIRLRTKARLLLTGTPLQNSLTELWSLLTFLAAGDEDDAAHHGTLEEFLTNWKEPVKEIFDRGVQTLSDEASRVVSQLHMSLRPFMLRRLKSEVEKDLPKKTEHTVVCKLSKRQRELYQDYMGLADTKAKLKQGNAVSAGRVLLALRRVCNHPDLFDPRPIQTSFAMAHSPLEPFAVKEKLIRDLLGTRADTPRHLLVAASEGTSRLVSRRSKHLSGVTHLNRQVAELERSLGHAKHDLSTVSGCQAYHRFRQRQGRLTQIRQAIVFTEATLAKTPVYGSDLREILTIKGTKKSLGCSVLGQLSMVTPNADSRVGPAEFKLAQDAFDRLQSGSTTIQRSLPTLEHYGERFQGILTRFAFCTPGVTSPVLNMVLPPKVQSLIRANTTYPFAADYAHEARIRNSIVFPDSRLLVYDSGKLQRLTVLLRDLQAKGSRCLIFTQMTYALDILERFLNLLGLTYLRLDGSTSPERRQFVTTEFNHPESKYQCMILSSRAGGVGLNLTGASSVIFFDLDWNPQMDKQCMDRAHRIGQVRDVEVFKMVSEKTVEENILRRANQKSLLDQAVIQDGRFTTDYNVPPKADAEGEEPDDVSAAIDRFLSGGDKAVAKTIESVEDKEDVQAAQQAQKEEQQDAEEFADSTSKNPSVPPTPGATGLEDPAEKEDAAATLDGHIDNYMIKLVEASLKNVPFVPPKPERRLDKHGRDPSHRPKKRR
jgi:helicase SWR1